MTKNIKDMNSVEYADYMIQSNRTWKNQQASAYRKDMKKQQRRSDIKSLLSIGSQELVYNADNRLKEMHVKNLPQTINYAANLAQANALEEERKSLLDKYGTAENIWQYQASSKAFSAPDIAKYGFKSLDDVEKALTTGLVSPEEYANLNKSYNTELERSKTLWETGKSFDKYNDMYTNTAVTGLTTLQNTKPKNSAIGVLRGKDDEYYDLATTTYNTIIEDNTAISQALLNRQKIISGSAEVKDVTGQTVTATQSSLINSDVPFASIKRNIAPLIDKAANEINNPQRIEARFDKLVEEKYRNNETFNATELWKEARRPFEGEMNMDKLTNVLNYIDIAKNNYNAPATAIEQGIKERFGWEVEFTAASPLTYAQLAVQNNGTISDELAFQLESTTEGKRILEANPNIYQDSVKAFNNEPTETRDQYKNQAIEFVRTIKENLDDPTFLSRLAIPPNDLKNEARKKPLEAFFRITDSATPTYQFGGVVSEMQSVLAKTIYDLDRQFKSGSITQDEKLTAINKRALEYIDNLEMKDNQLVFRLFSQNEFKQLNITGAAQSNSTFNPIKLEGQKALNNYNLAFESYSNNPDNNEAKDAMLSNAAIIIDGITKQNPNLNTIQKLRESSPSMNTLLNQIEIATPTKNVQEILEYLPVTNEVIAENIKQTQSTTTTSSTGFTFDTDINISDRPIINKIIEVESSGNPNAVSNHGAKGLMQLKDSTADNPGLGVRPAVRNADGSISPEENVRVGTDYFDALTEKYDGDLVTAAMAYNAGMGTIDKWIADGRNFSDLRKETQDYVKKIFGEDTYNELKTGQISEPKPTPAPTPTPSLLAADEDLTGFEELNKNIKDRGSRIRKERKSDLKLKDDFRSSINSLTADLTPRPISFFTQTSSEKTEADKLSVIRDEVKDKFGIDIDRLLRRSMSLPLVVEQNRQDIPKIIEYIEKRKQEILGD